MEPISSNNALKQLLTRTPVADVKPMQEKKENSFEEILTERIRLCLSNLAKHKKNVDFSKEFQKEQSGIKGFLQLLNSLNNLNKDHLKRAVLNFVTCGFPLDDIKSELIFLNTLKLASADTYLTHGLGEVKKPACLRSLCDADRRKNCDFLKISEACLLLRDLSNEEKISTQNYAIRNLSLYLMRGFLDSAIYEQTTMPDKWKLEELVSGYRDFFISVPGDRMMLVLDELLNYHMGTNKNYPSLHYCKLSPIVKSLAQISKLNIDSKKIDLFFDNLDKYLSTEFPVRVYNSSLNKITVSGKSKKPLFDFLEGNARILSIKSLSISQLTAFYTGFFKCSEEGLYMRDGGVIDQSISLIGNNIDEKYLERFFDISSKCFSKHGVVLENLHNDIYMLAKANIPIEQSSFMEVFINNRENIRSGFFTEEFIKLIKEGASSNLINTTAEVLCDSRVCRNERDINLVFNNAMDTIRESKRISSSKAG